MSRVQRITLAAVVPAALGIGYVAITTMGLGVYGYALFVMLPLAMTTMTMVIMYRDYQPKWLESVFAWLSMAMITSVGLLFLGIEGIICLLMAGGLALIVTLPFAVPLILFLRYLERSGRMKETRWFWPFVGIVLLPLLTAMEYRASSGEPRLCAVSTSAIVNAPREVVWNHVVSFSEITSEPAWYFQRGIAYPVRARIEGTGVGAVRHCEFTTGAFVEPITTWNEPGHLAFTVTSSPPAMTEWNPFHEVAPPHIHDYFESKRGEFYLEELPDGRTRLTGTTWYTHRIAPEWYWRWWTEGLLHDIHGRVLAHVASEAEKEARALAAQ